MKNTSEGPPEVHHRKIVDPGFLILCAVTALAAVGVVWKSGAGRAWEILIESLGFIAILAPKICAGAVIAATLPLLIPKEKIAFWIGRESGIRGLAIATLAGAATPGGPMMIFSLATGFAVAGADIGATIAFVNAWSLLSLNRTLIWELSFLPADLVWVRFFITLPFPILCGLIARAAYRQVAA
ncbi:MAG: hypothetical protein AAFX00_09295 [Pseudomonadota bacterium]